MIIGGLICTIGAVACALSPSIGVLIIARVVQGFGGGMASVVARAVIVDLAQGDRLARVMSIMMAIGGLAPMIAPVAGGAVLTFGGTWRTVFWCLVGFGLLMVITAILVVPESLPPERRHPGGLRQFASGIASVLRIRLFVAYLLTTAFSGFSMMAYVANSSYVLQVMKGVHPMPFALFFASTALSQVLLSLVNARLVGRFRPRTLIGFGLTMSSTAVIMLTVGVLFLGTPLLLDLRRLLDPDGGAGLRVRQLGCPGGQPGHPHRRLGLRRPRRGHGPGGGGGGAAGQLGRWRDRGADDHRDDHRRDLLGAGVPVPHPTRPWCAQGTNRCPTPGSVRKCRGRLGSTSSLRRSWAMKTRR